MNKSSSGTGVNLNSNTGSTISFSSLAVTTSAGTGVAATNSGTVNVSGGSISATGGPALLVNPTTLGMTFTSVTSTNSGTTGISLTSASGSLSIGTTTVTNPSGVGILVQGLTAGATASFGTTTGNGSGGTGVSLVDNVGNVSFGDLDIAPDSGQRALQATNNVANSGSITTASGTITASSGTAVEVNRTSAGTIALMMTLSSVSANGGTNGIFLNKTSGSFTVTGDGTGAANGSGGLITNTTATGVRLVTAQNVSLTQLNISNTGLFGIDISSVTAFTYQDASIVNAGDANEENTIQILNLFGTTNKIEDVTLDDIQEDGIQIRQNATDDGTRDELTIRRLNVQDHQPTFGEAGIEIQTDLGSNYKLLVDDSDFTLNTNAILGVAMSTAASHTGTLTVTVQNSTFNCANSFGSGSIQALGGGSGTANYNVTGNMINSTKFSGIIINNDDTQTTNANITGNTITGSGATNNGEGIACRQDENGSMKVLISGNTISAITSNGIRLISQDNTIDVDQTTMELSATVTNNTATAHNGTFRAGLLVEIGDGHVGSH